MMMAASTQSKPGARRRLTVLALALVAVLGVGVLAAVMAFPILFRVARVEGQAMAPTLRDQDRLLVYKIAYHATLPQRGDIVMMHYPVNPSKLFVKRVIAQSGDRLHIREGRVYLNDQPYDDSYVRPEFRGAGDWGPGVVPDGYYFVLGDRRNNSSDSRHWGFVPAKYIVGRVTLRWWPFADTQAF
jgi:signal peptidase I